MSSTLRSPPAAHGRPEWRLILLLGALAACGPISIDMYLPSLPSIARAFGVSAATAQATLTTSIAGFSLGMLLYGPLSDARGRRPVLLGGLVAYCAATLVCMCAQTIETLLAARFVQALGAGAVAVLARAIARDAHEPLQAARVISLISMVMSAGPLCAPLIGGQMLRLGGWRAVFALLAAFGAACVAAAWRKVPETWPRERRHGVRLAPSFAAYGALLADPPVLGYVLCGGMAFAATFAYITATPFVYIDYFHVSAQAYGLLFGVNILGIMGGTLLNARLVGRLGTVRMIGAASTVCMLASCAVGAVCLTGIGGLAAVAVSLFFVVGVAGLLVANCTTDMMHRYPRNAAAAAALFGALQLALGALSSIAVEALSDGTPRAMGIVIAACGAASYVGSIIVARLAATE